MDTLTASRWDDEYRNQRYANEPPLPFVDRILETLRADDAAGHGTGLYVGCGNGRNYLPLVDAGLELFGLDRNGWGGLTVRFDDGPKSGLLVHFFSDGELRERLTPAFAPVTDVREDVTVRAAPKTGSWAQWEAIWKRR